MHCYCGCDNRSNAIKWRVFLYCTISGLAFIGAGVLFWIINADEYDEVAATHNRDRTAVPLAAIGIILCVAASVPLYMMCCCTHAPHHEDEVGEFESTVPSDPRTSLKGGKLKHGSSSIGTSRSAIAVGAPSSFASARSGSKAGHSSMASMHSGRSPGAHSAISSSMHSARSAGAHSGRHPNIGGPQGTHAGAMRAHAQPRPAGRPHNTAEAAV